ncbi:MAG: hypothetical protein ACOY45_07765 [Pseudomonadota bacterium]
MFAQPRGGLCAPLQRQADHQTVVAKQRDGVRTRKVGDEVASVQDKPNAPVQAVDGHAERLHDSPGVIEPALAREMQRQRIGLAIDDRLETWIEDAEHGFIPGDIQPDMQIGVAAEARRSIAGGFLFDDVPAIDGVERLREGRILLAQDRQQRQQPDHSRPLFRSAYCPRIRRA